MSNLKSKVSEGRRYFATGLLKSKKNIFLLKYLKSLFLILSLLVVAFYLINKYYLSPFIVSSNSMFPNLKKGDLILVLKYYKSINPADIVVFKYKNKYFVKRVIGLRGEKIYFDGINIISKNCIFKIFNLENAKNNKLGFLEESVYCPKLKIQKSYKIIPTKLKPFESMYNGYFLLGDNRDSSFDSRMFGGVKKENIIGKLWYKFK